MWAKEGTETVGVTEEDGEDGRGSDEREEPGVGKERLLVDIISIKILKKSKLSPETASHWIKKYTSCYLCLFKGEATGPNVHTMESPNHLGGDV